jgi:hypothetical protein
MGVQKKVFCLNCKQTNACKCGADIFQFEFSYKLRPPALSKVTGKINKKEWQLFLDKCPQFANLLPNHLYGKFNQFMLNDVKYEKKQLNGRTFPFVASVTNNIALTDAEKKLKYIVPVLDVFDHYKIKTDKNRIKDLLLTDDDIKYWRLEDFVLNTYKKDDIVDFFYQLNFDVEKLALFLSTDATTDKETLQNLIYTNNPKIIYNLSKNKKISDKSILINMIDKDFREYKRSAEVFALGDYKLVKNGLRNIRKDITLNQDEKEKYEDLKKLKKLIEILKENDLFPIKSKNIEL